MGANSRAVNQAMSTLYLFHCPYWPVLVRAANSAEMNDLTYLCFTTNVHLQLRSADGIYV